MHQFNALKINELHEQNLRRVFRIPAGDASSIASLKMNQTIFFSSDYFEFTYNEMKSF